MRSTIKSSIITTLLMLLVCGIIYPLTTTLAAQLFFNEKANGSLIYHDKKIVGSKMIGQPFSSPEYLHPRPSAVNYSTYDKKEKEKLPASGGSNMSNQNEELKKRIETDIKKISKENNVPISEIPANLVTASGSGLDPHITSESAQIQIKRIAEHSGLEIKHVENIIKKHTHNHLVNVVEVNVEINKTRK